MSSKRSKTGTGQSAEEWEAFRSAEQSYKIDKAIEKVTGYPMMCDGVCFPIVYRAWMSHPALQVA